LRGGVLFWGYPVDICKINKVLIFSICKIVKTEEMAIFGAKAEFNKIFDVVFSLSSRKKSLGLQNF
jgi:hypothetical protein